MMNRSIIYRFIATSLLVLLCSVYVNAERKHALIIGLGKQEDKNWSKINGDKDVYVVKSMLTKCGFKDIRTLVNEKATKQGIAQAFLDLTRICKKGDIIYIHYSGHGQFITDLDGDESERWKGRHSQWDESWIPYDAYMYYCDKDKGEKHFSDDEIARFLTDIRYRIGRSGQLFVIVDACHSGDSTRGDDTECVRGVDVEFNIPRTPMMRTAKPIKEEWLTISACKPYQVCFEMKSPKMGKLTYALDIVGKRLFLMKNDKLQHELQRIMDDSPSRLPQNPIVSGRK
ncbi:MAG: caspase family protein [Bacteroidaceae bacterium]|nr:caspase family protein [Bacteroidaceae bacterium]